ncbi:MAG: ATP-binding cassette domain-containing protein [Acidobacteriota bacterium]
MSLAPVAVRDVSYAYGAGGNLRSVLSQVSFEVPPGEVVLLTGPSGSGKTTLLTLIGALRSAQSGSVRVLGEELAGASEDKRLAVRRQIGFVFQAHNLIAAVSARENVELALEPQAVLAPQDRRRRALDALAAVGLAEFAEQRPHRLSGGQRQRVAIARALAGGPRLVLADEPTASLDRASGREVVDLLCRLARESGVTVVIVTHDPRILDVAQRVLHLEDGQLSSLANAFAEATAQQMSALVATNRRGDLEARVEAMSEEQFAAQLAELTGEAQRLVGALRLAQSDGFESMLDRVLAAATRKIGQLLDAERASVFLVDWERRELWSKYAQGEARETLEIRVGLDGSIAGAAATSGDLLNVADAYADPRFDDRADRASGFRTRAILCAPLRGADGRVIAVAQALNRRGGGPFDAHAEQRFRDLAAPLAAILEAWVEMAGQRPRPAEAKR